MLEGEEEGDREGEAKAIPSGAAALEKAVAGASAMAGVGEMGKFLGPLLALFVVLQAVQTVAAGTGFGAVTLAGMGEEATTRVLSPKVPAPVGPKKNGRTVPAPSKVPIGSGRVPPPRAGGGGGFFVNQAAEMRRLVGR